MADGMYVTMTMGSYNNMANDLEKLKKEYFELTQKYNELEKDVDYFFFNLI